MMVMGDCGWMVVAVMVKAIISLTKPLRTPELTKIKYYCEPNH